MKLQCCSGNIIARTWCLSICNWTFAEIISWHSISPTLMLISIMRAYLEISCQWISSSFPLLARYSGCLLDLLANRDSRVYRSNPPCLDEMVIAQRHKILSNRARRSRTGRNLEPLVHCGDEITKSTPCSVMMCC